MTDAMLTPAQVARRCGVQRATVYGWIRSGLLPAVRVGRRVLRVREGVMSLPDDIGGADVAGAKVAAVTVLRGMGWEDVTPEEVHHAEMRTEIYDLD